MPRIHLLTLPLLGLLASGCATDCGDPRYDSLGTATGCAIGGGYDRQTDALADQAAASQAEADALRRENARLAAQQAALSEQERQARARLSRVNSDMAAQIEELERLRQRERISHEQYALLRLQVGDLNSQRAGVNPADPAAVARLERLEREVQQLRQAIIESAGPTS